MLFPKLFPRHKTNATMPIAAHTNSLQLALWSFWTAALVVCAALQWHTNVVAGQALNVLALIIHCGLTGLVGLVIMTWIEMRLEPWRFLE